MHPQTFFAFTDEMEKIAVTPGWVQRVGIGGLKKGLKGSRPKNPRMFPDNDTFGRISERVHAKAENTSWMHPIDKARWGSASENFSKAYLAH